MIETFPNIQGARLFNYIDLFKVNGYGFTKLQYKSTTKIASYLVHTALGPENKSCF